MSQTPLTLENFKPDLNRSQEQPWGLPKTRKSADPRISHIPVVYGRSLRQFADSVSENDFNDPDFKLYNKFLNVMALKEWLCI